MYEVLITAKVSDVFGSTTLLESRVGNYYLTNDSPTKMVNALLPAVAAAAALPKRLWSQLCGLESSRWAIRVTEILKSEKHL